MYDDDVQAPLGLGASDRYYKVAKFPTRNIKTPIVLVYGGSDSLVDIRVMLKELPRHTIAIEVPHFEHLDFLWGQEVQTLVFPHVFEALTAYSGRDHMKSTELIYKIGHSGRYPTARSSNFSEDDLSSPTYGDVSDVSPETDTRMQDVPLRKGSINRASPNTPRNRRYMPPPSSSSTEQTSMSTDGAVNRRETPWPKPFGSLLGNNVKHARKRGNSIASVKSSGSTKTVWSDGINIGVSRATVGVSSPGPSFRSGQRSPNATI